MATAQNAQPLQAAQQALAQSRINIAKLTDAQKTQILNEIQSRLGGQLQMEGAFDNVFSGSLGCVGCKAGLNVVAGAAIAAIMAAGVAVAPEAGAVAVIAEFFGASAEAVAGVINTALKAGAQSSVEGVLTSLCQSFGAC